jgi:hypothetical protein
MTQPTNPDENTPETPAKMNAFNQVASTTDNSDDSSPTSSILGGIFLIAVAAGLYFYFSDMESRNETSRIPAILALLYNIGGKNLVALLVGGLGALGVIAGISDWLKQNRS